MHRSLVCVQQNKVVGLNYTMRMVEEAVSAKEPQETGRVESGGKKVRWPENHIHVTNLFIPQPCQMLDSDWSEDIDLFSITAAR